MVDGFDRAIHYLRISVTDRCNLRCRYCMPEEGLPSLDHDEILHFDEIKRLVHIMAGLGVDRVRLTGGEPLVRKDIEHLAKAIKREKAIRFLGMTTNGILLEEKAQALLDAGVDGLNISLDTLDPERYRRLTRRDQFGEAWKGVQKALSLPFKSVKINSVLSPDSTPCDWLAVVALAKEYPMDVRLIEWMPMAGEEQGGVVRAEEALALIAERFGPLTELPKTAAAGPAQYYEIAGFKGKVGMIPAISSAFCSSCNRVRLTATGDLKLCLFYDSGISLKPMLRQGAGDEEIKEAILDAIAQKPQQHHGKKEAAAAGMSCGNIARSHGMYEIGG
ncbi:GTP 3',8-cyclase MoaA [Ruminococcaceae bacterium OttesenSCG-928-I18]|nr:GTP 3',8-cyclase MoaA [Ruminococcaceae bacterium OttesenSCG-928-I18]